MAQPLPPEVPEAIFRGALAAGAWDSLEPEERNKLRLRWRKQLQNYSAGALCDYAAAASAGLPLLLADRALHLKLADPQPSDTANAHELSSFIAFCNVHRRLICHGVDLKGIHILTELATFRRHEVVLGISGMGKSTYMARQFCQLAAYGSPMVLIDQEKILIEQTLPNLPEERHKDVIIIDPSDLEQSWGINLVQFARKFLDETDPQYANKVEYLNDRLSSEITAALAALQLDTAGYSPGPHVREALNNLFLAAVEHENTSMVDVYTLLTGPAVRDLVAPGVTRESVRNWLQYDLKAYDQSKVDGVRNKLHPFLRRVMVNTFSRRDSCLSIEQMLDSNKIVVLDLDATKLSKPVSRLIGYMFLILLRITLDHRYSKAVEEGRLEVLGTCYIMVDEFRNFSSTSTIDLFAEGRKRQASVIVGLQSLDQIDDDIANSLYNVSTWVVFNSGPEDAARVGKLFGMTNRLGMPRLEEITALPKYVAKLRYEGHRKTDGVQAYNFERVTLQTYPSLPEVPGARGILTAMRERSRREYYKPNTEDDTRTIYDENDQTNDAVLRAIWEANVAVRRPREYYLPGREHLVLDGAAVGYVAQGLIQAILEARNCALTKQRLAQSIRFLKARRLVVTEALPSGYKTTRLTGEGFQALAALISPGTSSNEGSPAHRHAVQQAFVALSHLGALLLSVPAQETDKYVPDLVIDAVPESLRAVLGLPEHSGPVHVQVEVATAQHGDRMATNIINAHRNAAYPLLILPDEASASRIGPGVLNAIGHGARGVMEQAERRYGCTWTALLQDGNRLVVVATSQGMRKREAPIPVQPLAVDWHLATAEFVDHVGSGLLRFGALAQYLAGKGHPVGEEELRAHLETTLGLHRSDAGAAYVIP